jgi:hypothetical protein
VACRLPGLGDLDRAIVMPMARPNKVTLNIDGELKVFRPRTVFRGTAPDNYGRCGNFRCSLSTSEQVNPGAGCAYSDARRFAGPPRDNARRVRWSAKAPCATPARPRDTTPNLNDRAHALRDRRSAHNPSRCLRPIRHCTEPREEATGKRRAPPLSPIQQHLRSSLSGACETCGNDCSS